MSIQQEIGLMNAGNLLNWIPRNNQKNHLHPMLNPKLCQSLIVEHQLNWFRDDLILVMENEMESSSNLNW